MNLKSKILILLVAGFGSIKAAAAEESLVHISDKSKATIRQYGVLGGALKESKQLFVINCSLHALEDDLFDSKLFKAGLGTYMGKQVLDNLKKLFPHAYGKLFNLCCKGFSKDQLTLSNGTPRFVNENKELYKAFSRTLYAYLENNNEEFFEALKCAEKNDPEYKRLTNGHTDL